MDYTEIIELVIKLIVAVLVTFVIPSLRSFLESKIEKERREKWKSFVDVAVSAAEQTFPATSGKEKKRFVFDWLDARGIEYDADEVDSMIEAAVIRLHNELRQ